MSKAIAFLAGLGAGYMGGVDKQREQERQDKSDAMVQTRFQNEQDDRARMLKERKDLQDAVVPRTVEQGVDLPDNRDVGQPGETAPQPYYRVGAQRFAQQGVAEAEAAKQNAPESVRARLQTALAQQDPLRAEQYRAATTQGDAAQLQLSEAQAAHVRNLYNNEVIALQDPDQVTKFVNKTKGDGQGGALQVVKSVTPDGKTVSWSKIMPDGSSQPFFSAENSPQGMERVRAALMRLPPELMLTHLHQQDLLSRQDRAQSEQERHHKAIEADQSEKNALKLQLASLRAGSGAPTAETPEGTFDRKAARDMAHDVVKKEAENASAGGKPLTAGEIATRTDAIVGAMYQQHLNRFVQNAVGKQLTLASADPELYSSEYAKARKLNLSPERLQSMGFAPPPGSPEAKAQTTAAASPTAAPAGVAGQPAATTGTSPAAPAYTPPPSSGVAKMRERASARQQALAAAQQQERELQMGQTRAAIRGADAALQARDPRAAYEVAQMPGFGALDIQTKTAISNLMNGR